MCTNMHAFGGVFIGGRMASKRHITPVVDGLHLDWVTLLSVSLCDIDSVIEAVCSIGYVYVPYKPTERYPGVFRRLTDFGLQEVNLLSHFRGFSLNFGGKTCLRSMPLQGAIDHVLQVESLLRDLGYKMTLTRVDWAVQIPDRGDPVLSTLVGKLARLDCPFTVEGLPDENSPFYVASASGRSIYRGYQRTERRKSGGRACESVDRWKLCAYQAQTAEGVPVLRCEVREQFARRALQGSLSMTDETFAALNCFTVVSSPSCGVVSRWTGVAESTRVQLCKAVTALVKATIDTLPGRLVSAAGTVPETHLRDVVSLALTACEGDVDQVLRRWPSLGVVFENAGDFRSLEAKERSARIASYQGL